MKYFGIKFRKLLFHMGDPCHAAVVTLNRVHLASHGSYAHRPVRVKVATRARRQRGSSQTLILGLSGSQLFGLGSPVVALRSHCGKLLPQIQFGVISVGGLDAPQCRLHGH